MFYGKREETIASATSMFIEGQLESHGQKYSLLELLKLQTRNQIAL